MSNNEPNGVLFHLDDGKAVFILRKNNEWDWNDCRIAHEDQWKDLSVSNPFEFVFIYYDDTDPKTHRITTFNTKTCIPNASFLTLQAAGILKNCIDMDYKMQCKGLINKL